ncbi:MAG TPA: hypothetical protein VGB76_03130 [Pyrinomonadaceae bacterium]|jgi:hypothetical protein
MLLSEFIIIYLAAAAPFGVTNFLRQPAGARRTRSLLHATGAALLWPLTLLSLPFVHKKFRRVEPEAAAPEVSLSREQRTEVARRALLSSLYRMEDLAEEVPGLQTEATRSALRETISAVERYVGLALAVAEADEAASVRVPRETELCRLSGRAGDDLHIATLCHGRRNIARLRAHGADSRLELLHALAELREVFESTHAATPTEAQAVAPSRHLFAALLETYMRAIDLLSLFEDERAAATVVRLLDAVRARLRRSESLDAEAAPPSLMQTDRESNVTGDEPCITSIPQTNPQTQLSPTQTIRVHG